MKNTARSIIIAALFGFGLCQKQVQEDPCKTKNRVVADATHCDRYWECQDGQPELYDCPNGLVYAGKNRGVTEGCDYPWRANYCDGKTQANGPIGKEHCDWLYGIFGHETSCTRYWTCWNGTSTEQLCIGGLLYNENTHSCDWPENVDGCQKHPLCNEDANGNVPLGKSCNRYWQCQGGYPRLQRCPAMLVFDKRTLRCVVPPTEDCEAPTTEAPLPEDIDDEDQPNIPQRPQSQARPQQFHQAQQSRPQSFQPQAQQERQRPQQQQQQQQRNDFQQPTQRNDYQQPTQQQPQQRREYQQQQQQQTQQQQQQRNDYQKPAQQQPQQRREHQQPQQKPQQRNEYQNYQQQQQQQSQRNDNQQNYNQHQAQQRSDELGNIPIPPGAIPLNKRQRN